MNKALKQAKFILPGLAVIFVAYLLLKPAISDTVAKIEGYSPFKKAA